MKRMLLALAALLVIGAAGFLGLRMSRPETVVREADTLYRCPMHHQIVSSTPGHCPICNMALVEFTPGGTAEAAAAATVTLDPSQRRLVGARTIEVASAPFVRRIRTVGRIAIDETRMQHVHTKVQGWIEHLHAGAAGEVVRRGDPLLTIFSPELLASQEEYIVALDHRASLGEEGERLVASARRRLELQDMTDAQIAQLASTRKAHRVVTLYSPVTGIITARNVSHGERVESATSLLDIADLGSVWLVAELYEADLPYVRDGQEAEATITALPGRRFRAPIKLVAPVVDAATRTTAARIELRNADLTLRPGMFAEVSVSADLGSRLSIPKDAVVRTGARDLVFVTTDDASFTPREVALGIELPDRWEVTAGLTPGEHVLEKASFLIDSESKLRSAAPQATP